MSDTVTVPNFDDYMSARTYAWATGAASATVDGTEYRKEWDDVEHQTPDRTSGVVTDCARCRRVFRRIYGDPPLASPVDRVARFLAFYDDLRADTIHTVAGSGTDGKDVSLLVSDLRFLVEIMKGLDAPS